MCLEYDEKGSELSGETITMMSRAFDGSELAAQTQPTASEPPSTSIEREHVAALEQKEAELNRRAADLDKRAAEIASRTATDSSLATNLSSPTPTTPPEPTVAAGGDVKGATSKAEWRAKVSQLNNGALVNLGRVVMEKATLLNAVGQPVRTQTVDNDLYLYWECSDGVIQVVCSAQHYILAAFIVGTINDY